MKQVWSAASLAAGALMLAMPAEAQYSAFYAATSADLAGAAGTVIRSEPLPEKLFGAKAYRVLYRSTGLAGEPIAVSGVVVVPDARQPEAPVVAWAHPTTGVADKCAPSIQVEVLSTIPGLDDMLKRGFVVTATDYQGLGTAGEHPYLVGISEGRGVLDSVRAARALSGAGERFGVWGHSQGGHAALWTGELAREYAPELNIVGMAAAAPASLLAALFEDDLGTTAGKGLTALTLWSWSKVFDASLDTVVLPEAMSDVAKIGAECLDGFTDLVIDIDALSQIKRSGFLSADPDKTKPWPEIMASNTPGQMPAGAPVFIAQGSADTVVDPPVTTAFATELCRQRTAVRFFEVPDATHEVIAKASAMAAVAWIGERFAGKAAPTNCIKD
ncbi:MAG: lipase family protein [Bauldia sp.]|nr:lipase family protein [Bauldia sp.]